MLFPRTRLVSRSVRNFSSMFESKNNIKSVRSKYYSNPTVGAENPTYLKEPSDKIVFAIGAGGIFLGFAMILNGLRSMSLGINKTP